MAQVVLKNGAMCTLVTRTPVTPPAVLLLNSFLILRKLSLGRLLNAWMKIKPVS
ncbi:hypothetical protein L914_15434, partial [Phytophthora nicotianae]